ncbi:MAG: AzlD domain-containing protein [Acidimicrobiia bacterium]|nr:AzlD domain-containing protein [Acidimicrobiia bacterium]
MSAWFAAAIVGLGTYLTRASFLVTLADRDLPPVMIHAMRNVAPAVLAALVASILVGERGVAGLAQPVELVALSVALVVAARTRNLTATLATGMAAFWIARWFAG